MTTPDLAQNTSATSPSDSVDSDHDSTPSRKPRAQKILQALGWTGFFVAFLLLFTLIKLPEIRLKNYIQGTLSSMLSSKGITLTAAKSELSFLFGITYVMKDVTINLPPPDVPVKVDRLEFSPSLLPMLLGKVAGSARVEQGSGFLKSSFSASGLLGSGGKTPAKTELSASFRAKDFNIGKVALLQILAGIRGAAVVDGEGSFSGDMSQPSSWSGEMKIDIAKLTLDAQGIYGFSVPALRIAEGKIDLSVGSGKATIKTFKLGKTGAPDDLVATVTGDLLLGKTWDTSSMNLKTHFTLSQNIMKSLSLLEMVLGQGKQADGSFAYNLSGPIGAPNAVAGGK
jgi:type II secretion system protein N